MAKSSSLAPIKTCILQVILLLYPFYCALMYLFYGALHIASLTTYFAVYLVYFSWLTTILAATAPNIVVSAIRITL